MSVLLHLMLLCDPQVSNSPSQVSGLKVSLILINLILKISFDLLYQVNFWNLSVSFHIWALKHISQGSLSTIILS